MFFGNKNYAPLLKILTSCNFKCLIISHINTLNVDIFACIHFCGFMKIGNFACIKIRSLTCSLGYSKSNFQEVHIFSRIFKKRELREICTARKYLRSQYQYSKMPEMPEMPPPTSPLYLFTPAWRVGANKGDIRERLRPGHEPITCELVRSTSL